jgi:hypothetical protein
VRGGVGKEGRAKGEAHGGQGAGCKRPLAKQLLPVVPCLRCRLLRFLRVVRLLYQLVSNGMMVTLALDVSVPPRTLCGAYTFGGSCAPAVCQGRAGRCEHVKSAHQSALLRRPAAAICNPAVHLLCAAGPFQHRCLPVSRLLLARSLRTSNGCATKPCSAVSTCCT